MNTIERFRKYRKGGIVKYQNPANPITFRQAAKKRQSQLPYTYDNVYASELGDSIQDSSSGYLDKLGNYKTAVSRANGNYMSLDAKGVFNYSGKSSPYFKGFNSQAARQIYNLGTKMGLNDNQIAVLIESGWRESNLNHKKYGSNNNAYGIWQFDIPAGTYRKYQEFLRGRPDSIGTQMEFLIKKYMPTRGNYVQKYWNNPNVSLEELARQFLIQVEAPKDRNNPQLQNRTKRAVRTLRGRK